MHSNDFYEEDEPVEDVVAAFERGRKVLTRQPGRGQTVYLDSNGNEIAGTTTV